MLAEGEIILLMIEKLVYGGQGLGHHGEQAVFVPRAAPGDELRVRIVRSKRGYAVGEIADIVRPSSLRVSPPCPYYERCGGCQLQHLSYADQLRAKVHQVRETLVRIGGAPPPTRRCATSSRALNLLDIATRRSITPGLPGKAGCSSAWWG